MHDNVSTATTELELLESCIMRLAVAYDNTKSARDLVTLSSQLLKLLREREALMRSIALAATDAEATAAAATAAAVAAESQEVFLAWLAELG